MTEQTWLTSIDPDQLQAYLRSIRMPSDRKYRLFACSCCRRVAHLLTDHRNCQVMAVVERFADGQLSPADLRSARDLARAGMTFARGALEEAAAAHGVSRALAITRPLGEPGGAWLAAAATLYATNRTPGWQGALQAAACAAEAVAWVAARVTTGLTAWLSEGSAVEDAPWTAPWNAARKAARTREECEQAALLRHIVGNPYRPYAAADHWPSTVVQLAEALYDGQDCDFALHDALLEAGHPDLAEHFHQERSHPKGCWVLDVLLGKE